jgi:hypothetical protein
MTGSRNDIVWMRETEAGGCGACGSGLSQSETGFPTEVVVEALFDDPALLEPLLVRRCRNCGAPYGWDVLIAAGEDDLDREWGEKEAQQAEVHAALREMLRTPRLQPRDAAKRIRRRFRVEGIYVDDSSEVVWPLRRLRM